VLARAGSVVFATSSVDRTQWPAVAGTLRQLQTDFVPAQACVSRDEIFVGWNNGQISAPLSIHKALSDAEQVKILEETTECRDALRDLLEREAAGGAI